MKSVALAALLAASASGAQRADPLDARVLDATKKLASGAPAEAVAVVEPALAAYERRYAPEKRRIYCGYSMNETLAYMAMAAAEKRDAVAIAPGWCDALFVKGFALVDLKRVDEGAPYLERAAVMAPLHAHFLNELGFVYQRRGDWAKSYDAYARAADATAHSDKQRVVAEKTRAWRGMGYALVEQGKWDEAAALYRRCLELDPNDGRSKAELAFIAERRPK